MHFTKKNRNRNLCLTTKLWLWAIHELFSQKFQSIFSRRCVFFPLLFWRCFSILLVLSSTIGCGLETIWCRYSKFTLCDLVFHIKMRLYSMYSLLLFFWSSILHFPQRSHFSADASFSLKYCDCFINVPFWVCVCAFFLSWALFLDFGWLDFEYGFSTRHHMLHFEKYPHRITNRFSNCLCVCVCLILILISVISFSVRWKKFMAELVAKGLTVGL